MEMSALVYLVDSSDGVSLAEFGRRLTNITNMLKAKEDKLKGRHMDTHSAIQWLRQNRQLFSGNVHEPMLLVVSLLLLRSWTPSQKALGSMSNRHR